MAPLSAEHILNRVAQHERKRSGWLSKVEDWDRMARLDPGYNRTVAQAIEEGQEQIVLPTPFNVMNLSQRLLSGTPQTKVLPLEPGNRESEDQAETVEKWLKAMWKRVGQVTKRHVLNDIILFSLLRGRFAVEVKWVEDDLPPLKRGKGFPISIRALDPKNVGIMQGPLYTAWVYHRYDTTVFDVLQRWPELRDSSSDEIRGLLEKYDGQDGLEEDIKVTVIDFWWVDVKTGKIWNAVLVQDAFVKKPAETEYPDLPIIVGRGDYIPGLGDDYDGLSILHPLLGLWDYQCRLASQMATGLLWHFWPATLIYGGNADVDIGPGTQTDMPLDSRVELLQIDPNIPLAQTVYQQIDQHVQQSAYPEVMYGKAPGDLQAGYGVSLLSDAAKGRIKNFQEGLEMVLSQVNSLVLGIVEVFATKGVTIWGYDQRDQTKYHLTLDKSIIAGNYENEVSITPVIPSAMMQMQTLGIRLADAKYISRQTLRDNFLDIPVPSDEEARLLREELMDADELRGFRLRQAALKWEPKKWLEILSRDPMSQQLLPQIPGYHWTVEGDLERDEIQGPGAIPPAMPPEAMLPMGGMGMGAPAGPPGPGPMGPGGPPPGMIPQGGMPPGMPPGGGPPPGIPGGSMPPGMGGPPPVQPPMVMTGPEGAGGPIPPAMQGLMSPGDMGMPPQENPLGFASLMGNPMSPEEELIRMAGMVPPRGM